MWAIPGPSLCVSSTFPLPRNTSLTVGRSSAAAPPLPPKNYTQPILPRFTGWLDKAKWQVSKSQSTLDVHRNIIKLKIFTLLLFIHIESFFCAYFIPQVNICFRSTGQASADWTSGCSDPCRACRECPFPSEPPKGGLTQHESSRRTNDYNRRGSNSRFFANP